MLPTLIIEASDGTSKATLDCTTTEATFSRREMDRATATLDEDAYAAVDIDPVGDRLFIDRPDGTRLFGGRFDDDQRDGATITVTIASFRRDAIDAEPTGRSLTFQNVADTTVVQDAIDNVPTLTAGTIEELAPALSFEFPNSSRAKQIRKAAVATGAAVRYNPDRTVDYVDQLGSDHALTLSPTNQNIVSNVNVTEDVRDRVTHVRAFGSRELNLTRDAVTDSYNGGREVWRKYEDTDIRSGDRLQQIADRLANEYDGEPRELTVEATVIGEDLQRGDRVTVRLPDRDIDRLMTITRLIERFGQRGRELVVTLKNRLVDDDAMTSGRESLQRFNRGYQGFVDRNQTSSGWNVAGDGTPQTLEIVAYPDDIVTEERVDLQVQGRAWRAPLDITSHTHDVPFTTTSASNSEFTAVVEETSSLQTANIDSSLWTSVDSITPSSDTAELRAFGSIKIDSNDASTVKARLRNITTGETYGEQFFNLGDNSINSQIVPGGFCYFTDPSNTNGETLRLEFRPEAGGFDVVIGTYYVGIGKHTHDVSQTVTSTAQNNGTAKVVTSFGGQTFYPRDVDIRANGTLVATISGNANSGFTETVDLTGELSAGQNTIEAEPTAERGSLNLNLATELFRRGP